MFNISQSAIEQVVQDIKNGVEYPDFWTNRYEEQEQTEEEKQEEEKAVKTK